MFLGHYGLGMGGKSVEPRISLGTWFMAVQFLDLLWPIFLLLGWEHVRVSDSIAPFTSLEFYDYPISHSLAGALGWSVAFGGVVFLVTHRGRSAWLLGAGVFSHWILDFLVHEPDLLLLPGGTQKVGLALWDRPRITLLIEIPIYLIGIVMYHKKTRPKDGVGRFGLWALLLFLSLIYLSNFGPPPPNERAIAWGALAGWLLVAWAYWVDRHRETVKLPL